MTTEMKRDWEITSILIGSSILTLGIINLVMYLIDDITPQEFFDLEMNPLLQK